MKSISLSTRILTLNLVVSSLILGGLFTYFEQIRQAKERADRSNSVATFANKAALHINEMTIGIRGFMLDPTLTSEWQNKLKADANAVQAMKSAKDVSFNPAVTSLMEEMAAMDEKMDALENEFGELVKAGNMKEAQRFYFTDYLPILQKMAHVLDRVRDQTQSDAKNYGDRQSDLIQKGGTWIAGGIFVILFFLLGVNQWISARLTRKIGQLSGELGASVTSIELASKNTVSASQQIATSATEKASAITETLSMADAGRKEADRGREVISAMANSMREVFESRSRLETLIKVIEDIKSKTKVINDIVFETRLLAFNASIEAARAGSHGKGFAVVAEEVGKLASVSGKAAEEIHTLLEQSTQQVTDIVATTSTRVGTARESSMQCEQVFNQMSISLNEINRAMQDMEKETRQNSAISEEMANHASTLAHEAKALSNLVIQIRGLVHGNGEGSPRTESPKKKKVENIILERSTGPQATPRLKVVSSLSPGTSEGQYAEEGPMGRDDARWKIG